MSDAELQDFNLHVSSEFNPNVTSPALDTFINLVKTDLGKLRDQIRDSGVRYPNITQEEISALKELADNQNITNKLADKDGAIVIMDTHKYMGEIRRQLADTNVYQITFL